MNDGQKGKVASKLFLHSPASIAAFVGAPERVRYSQSVNAPDPQRPRLVPPLYFLLALLLMVILHLALPYARVVVPPWRWLGVPFVVVGLVVILWAARLFGHAGTPIRPLTTPTALVSGGPYNWTRNPIYLGMTVVLLGVAFLLGTFPPFLVLPAFVTVMDRQFVRAEEAALETTFGEAYRRYKAAVRRWI